MRNLGEAGVWRFKLAELHRIPEFPLAIDLDVGKSGIAVTQVGELAEHFRDAAVRWGLQQGNAPDPESWRACPYTFAEQPSCTSCSKASPNADGLKPFPTPPMKLTTPAAIAARSEPAVASPYLQASPAGARMALPQWDTPGEGRPD